MSPQLGSPLVVERRATDSETSLFSVAGDLVVTTLPVLDDALSPEIEAGGRHISLDLSAVTHIDTPGLALICRFHERLSRRDGDLVVIGLPERFVDLVHDLCLDEVLDFRPRG